MVGFSNAIAGILILAFVALTLTWVIVKIRKMWRDGK